MAGRETPTASIEKEIINSSSVTISRGDGISKIGTILGIRQSYLQKLEEKQGLGTLREGDVFRFDRTNTGVGTLSKVRSNQTIATFDIPKESIYQNIEGGPITFPYVSFVRVPQFDEYQLVGKQGEQITKDPIVIPTANLDAFREELSKISGAFITECGSRNAQNELSCTIGKNPNFPNRSVTLNSQHLFDFVPTHVSLESLMHLTKRNHNTSALDMAKVLASSLSLNYGRGYTPLPTQYAKESLRK